MTSNKIASVLLFVIIYTASCSSQPTITQEDIKDLAPYQTPLNPNNQIQISTAESTIAASQPEKPIRKTRDPILDITETVPVQTKFSPQVTQSVQTPTPELSIKIDRIINRSGGRWHIVFKEVGGPIHYAINPEQRINIASLVKVPLALLFFTALADNGIPEDDLLEHLNATGTGGRTFGQLLRAMLVVSEEDATDILSDYSSGYLYVPEQLRLWNLESMDLNARRYTALGVASIFERFYLGEFVSSTARDLILGYLGEYSPNDNSRIGVLNAVIPDHWNLYNKRGSLLTPYVVADSAVLENLEGQDYIITIFAYNSEPETTYENLDQAIGEIALAFWDYISSQNVPYK